MKYFNHLLLPLLLAIGMTAGAFAGAGNRVGTGGASELLIPTGARDIAMGGSTVATASGVEALFWNPAGVAKMKNGASLYVSHMNYIADISVDYGAVAGEFEGLGVISLAVKSLAIGEIPVTTTANPDGTGELFSPTYFIVGATYSRQLSDRIAVGLTANFVTERIAEVSANGVSFDAGVIYDNLASISGLSLGVAVKNVGPPMRFDGPGMYVNSTVTGLNRSSGLTKIDAAEFELPSTFEFGIGYKRAFDEQNAILLATTFQNNNFSDDEYKVGAEYAFQDLFFIRGGYNFSQKESDAAKYIFGPSFGAGLHSTLGTLDLTIDYAFRAVELLDDNHIISLKVGF